MTITENKNNDVVELVISGRLDTTTSPQLEVKLNDYSRAKINLILNLQNVEYISSAGLRVVLLAHKMMLLNNGRMIIRSPSEFCKQVFEATGMADVLNIE